MKHFKLNQSADKKSFRSPSNGRGNSKFPPRDSKVHGEYLRYKFVDLWEKAEEKQVVSFGDKEYLYMEIIAEKDFELDVAGLDNRNIGTKLLNSRQEELDDGTVLQKATIRVEKQKRNYFLKYFNEYINEKTPKDKPKHESLLAPIEDFQIAIVESFWVGDKDWMPSAETNEKKWCEVWLNDISESQEELIKERLREMEILHKERLLKFPERNILIANVSFYDIEEILTLIPFVTEIRKTVEVKPIILELDLEDKEALADDILERLNYDNQNDVYTTILDTGLNNGHPLLEVICPDEDTYSYFSYYDPNDNSFDGHGTGMAGIILYGDLTEILTGVEQVIINHGIESVKILPDTGENDEDSYADIMAQSVSQVEINNPSRLRIFCMAVTASKYYINDGTPSLWSAKIDQLAYGESEEEYKRLFIVSAGNIRDEILKSQYPYKNKTEAVEDPAQSWNALSVGAYIETHSLDKENLGKKGELSPFSRTSYLWDKHWPMKPDIVLDGGTTVVSDDDKTYTYEGSSLITTSNDLSRYYDITHATSSATALASRMASIIRAEYPSIWPESVRGLIIHSAEWTDELKEQFLPNKNSTKKSDLYELMRICGYGVPSLHKAKDTMNNRVNMIIEGSLQPYMLDGSTKAKDMDLYELPWPKEQLLALENTPVKLKVTLSYFIEPSPGERGWNRKFTYQSHGLRFDLNGSQSREEFEARINKNARDELSGGNSPIDWRIGTKNRRVGSIISDVWETTASELALSNIIGIFPVTGWWKTRRQLGKYNNIARYSLIVSLETVEEVDLYTSIKTIIDNQVEIEV